MSIRNKLAELSRTVNDASAAHALLIWLDTLPPSLLIAAEGRRRAEMQGMVTDVLPRYRPPANRTSTVDVEVDLHCDLARIAWEHPSILWSGKNGER